jgi:hypothetical protein
MAERIQKVYDRVLQEVGKNPQIGSRELYGIAQTVDKTIGRDSMQQFHARYYLPAMRERRAAEGGGSARRGPRQRTRAARQEKSETPVQAAASEPAPRTRRRRSQSAVASPQNGTDRDRIRSVLLQFAQELTDADSRSGLVQVLGKVDTYVDRIAGRASN